MATPPLSCWVLHDGAAGHRRQALALAQALAPEVREFELHTAMPWSWLAPRRLPGAEKAFGPGFLAGLRPPPTRAIGAGRRAALATRLNRAPQTLYNKLNHIRRLLALCLQRRLEEERA